MSNSDGPTGLCPRYSY